MVGGVGGACRCDDDALYIYDMEGIDDLKTAYQCQTTSHVDYSRVITSDVNRPISNCKTETSNEKYHRILGEIQVKNIKSVTRGARHLLKKKQMKKMSAYFSRKSILYTFKRSK
jgi:hypothetical protein